jgi:hypothetical protein
MFSAIVFSTHLEEASVVTLPKPGKDPKFPQNLRPICLLSTTDKIFEKVIQKVVQMHLDENDLLNASHFDFRALRSTTLQFMSLMNYVTFKFKNSMSTAVVFLDIEKPFDTIWHTGLLYKLSKLHFFREI